MKRIEQFQDMIARLFPDYDLMFENEEERTSRLSRTVTFAVTDACSLRCTYCYQGIKAHHVLDFEVAKKFADMILEGNKYVNPEISEGVIIEFIGGEPFLEIELIDKITDYVIRRMIKMHHPWATRYRLSICSNGTEYFNENVQRYIAKHKTHLSFSISIDGNKELHDACRVFPDGSGSYDIAIAGVNHWIGYHHGIMGSKMTLAPANVSHTFDAVQNLIELGYDEINLNCVYEEGWNHEYAKILYEQLKMIGDYVSDRKLDVYLSIFEENFFTRKKYTDTQNWCGGTGAMISVDYTGNIYPCIRYMPNSLQGDAPPLIIGTVDDGIEVRQCDIDTVKYLNDIDRRTQSNDFCFDCPIAEGCSWCSAYNYQIHGTVDKRVTYICVMHQARALANVYYWNKLYRATGASKRMKITIPKEWALKIIDEDEYNMLLDLSKDD